jgi:tripartite-type tricarboxylate transporter receptor subunit TctC
MAWSIIFLFLAPLQVCSQDFPTKPLRLILPFPPGGAIDILGRIIGPKFSERFGQPVVPGNRPGAAGNIAYEAAAKAKPDGYTIVLGGQGLAVSTSLYKKLNYDPIRDFAPISLVSQVPFVVAVRPSLPINSLKELVQYAKANPGKLNFGSAGINSPHHLAGELLKNLAKINIVHVSYKGAGPALIGLMGGEVDMVVSAPSVVAPQVQTGKVRVLAVLSKERFPSLPNAPTAKEAGIENFEVASWHGILAPVGTPRDIIKRLNAEWIRIMAMPDTKEKMQKAEFEPLSTTPEQFSEFLKAEILRWGRVIKEANISSD